MSWSSWRALLTWICSDTVKCPQGHLNSLDIASRFLLSHHLLTTWFATRSIVWKIYIGRIWTLRGLDGNGDYNPSIYLKSDYEFKLAPIHIKQALKAFKIRAKQRLLQLQQQRLRKPKCNLSSLSMSPMEYLKNNTIYIAVHGDKNLGPCIL